MNGRAEFPRQNDTKWTIRQFSCWANKRNEILFSGWPGPRTGTYVLTLISIFVVSVREGSTLMYGPENFSQMFFGLIWAQKKLLGPHLSSTFILFLYLFQLFFLCNINQAADSQEKGGLHLLPLAKTSLHLLPLYLKYVSCRLFHKLIESLFVLRSSMTYNDY